MRKLGRSGRKAQSNFNQTYYMLILAHTDHILYCLPKPNPLLVSPLSIKITTIHLDSSHNPRQYLSCPLSLLPHIQLWHTPQHCLSSYHQPELMQEAELFSPVLHPSNSWFTRNQKGSF